MATAFAVSYTGAVPIPVDIDLDTWNISPHLLEGLITPKTKAILVVHIFGHPVDMDPILSIARKHNLYVVEDCAEAHGAMYKNRKVGAIGDVGCFSFYANKIISTGEGGMVVTNSETLHKKMAALKSLSYGTGANRFMHENIGFNYRLPNTIAAIGCAQMESVGYVIDQKRYIASFYQSELAGISGVQLPVELSYAYNVYWMYHILLVGGLKGKRQAIMDGLQELGIETRVSFCPMNQQKVYLKSGNFKIEDCPNANYVGENGFYLPSGPIMNNQELQYVVDCLKSLIPNYR
jgi:perosamine synthetase